MNIVAQPALPVRLRMQIFGYLSFREVVQKARMSSKADLAGVMGSLVFRLGRH